MKKITFLLPLFLLIILWIGCTEVGPSINLLGSTEITPPDRIVLIEEFTGVRCVNCPEGSEQIETLLGIYGESLIAVSIHAGFFAEPYSESTYDFRTTEGSGIESLLGPAAGYPTASVNRRQFDSESEILIERNKWAGYIAQEKEESPKMALVLEKNYNTDSRLLEVTAKISFNETVSEPIRISAMITENNILDTQLTPDGKVNDYSHKHVLRTMMTNFDGDLYSEGTNVGDTGEKSFSMTLPADWNEANCHVIIFMHEFQSKKDILQAVEVGVIE